MARRTTNFGMKATAKVVIAVAAITTLSACSAGEGTDSPSSTANGGSGSNEKSTAAAAAAPAPTASERDLLLTDEVSGVTFEARTNPHSIDAVAGSFTEGVQVEPASCSGLSDATVRISDLAGSFAEIKEDQVVVSVSLSKNTDLYSTYNEAIKGCEDVTVSIDGTQATQKLREDQNLPPEAMGMFEGMNLSSTLEMHTREWITQISTKPSELIGHESTANGHIMGASHDSTSYQIMGIVNNVLIIVISSPTANFDMPANGDASAPDQASDTTQTIEAAKRRAAEIFDAQAQKIIAAS